MEISRTRILRRRLKRSRRLWVTTGVGGARLPSMNSTSLHIDTLLTGLGIDHGPFGDAGAIRFEFAGRNGRWRGIVRSTEDPPRLLIHSVVPVAVPADRRAAVAELLTRVNFGTVLGGFEMDYDDGEVRFKVSFPTEDGPVSERVFETLMMANLTTFDLYAQAVASVVEGTLSPTAALAWAERPE